ncbi:MAG: CHAT domain-containing protein, partial [Pirellulales bacterium]
KRLPFFTEKGDLLETPWKRCGLCLSGCNAGNAENGIADDKDGFLTGEEVLDLDFEGTALVVLSACGTGRGQIQCGDGVAGLRQAFLLSGASSVVASLWGVADDSTAVFMANFYETLNRETTPAEALARTQRESIANLREKKGQAHPAAWAAFGITGRNVAVYP